MRRPPKNFSFSSPAASCNVVLMADHLSRTARSANMAAIRSKNTAPELAVRRIVHALGYRYRLHDPKLPGCPGLVSPRGSTGYMSIQQRPYVRPSLWSQTGLECLAHFDRRCSPDATRGDLCEAQIAWAFSPAYHRS